MNGRALPSELRLPVMAGDVRLFRLEQGVLRLGAHGQFTLYFRYYHQLVRRGSRPVPTPVLSDSESGTYSMKADRLVLTPVAKKGGRNRPAITATITGQTIVASYVLRDATSHERITLVLLRDATYW